MARIALAVTGGIAAYKACDIARGLMHQGHDVRVCMTDAAQKFITPLSFEALTHHEVLTSSFQLTKETQSPHIALSQWADVLCVAPATAHTLASMAYGLGDTIAALLYLAFDGPVVVCPAMNEHMLAHAATQHNLELLRSHGVHMIDSVIGNLACGGRGQGVLADPSDIVSRINDLCVMHQINNV